MNDALKMQISAFVDGELAENEAQLLLRRLSQDAAMRQQVAEYLAIGRLARRERSIAGVDLLRGRIASALGEEPVTPAAPAEIVGSRFMNPATGIGVAATVAVIALVGLGQLGGPAEPGLDGAIAVDLGGSYTEPTPNQVGGANERLQEYSRRHNDSSYDLGSNDIISRMVTFELREGELVEIEPDPHLLSEDASPEDLTPDSADQ